MDARTELEPWLVATTNKVIEKLQNRVAEGMAPQPAGSEPRPDHYIKRFDILSDALRQDSRLRPSGRRSVRPPLQSMIRGYLVEFVRQSEEGTPPCNTEFDKNPAAAANWAERPEADFKDAKMRGLLHSAAVYRRLGGAEHSQRRAAMGAMGEIIRATIDTFNTEFPKRCPEIEPRASVGNDPIEVARTGHLWDEIVRQARGGHHGLVPD